MPEPTAITLRAWGIHTTSWLNHIHSTLDSDPNAMSLLGVTGEDMGDLSKTKYFYYDLKNTQCRNLGK